LSAQAWHFGFALLPARDRRRDDPSFWDISRARRRTMESDSDHILGAQSWRMHRADERQQGWADMIAALSAGGIG
jgi:hypothetical protein